MKVKTMATLSLLGVVVLIVGVAKNSGMKVGQWFKSTFGKGA